MFRLIQFCFSGLVGASLGWLFLEPWAAEYSTIREFLLLYAVSLGIVFALVAEQLIYTRNFKKALTSLGNWQLFVIPVIGVFLIQLLFTESDQSTFKDETAEERILLLDVSSSMSGRPLRELKRATAEYLSTLQAAESKDVVGIVAFSNSAVLVATPQNDYDALTEAISLLESGGGTNMLAGFQMALQAFQQELPRDIILVSDGEPNEPDLVRSFLPYLEGIPISSVGVGADYDGRFLSHVASTTGGEFLRARDASDLVGILEELAGRGITKTVDAEGEALPFWKRLLGWGLLGLVLGLTIGLGRKSVGNKKYRTVVPGLLGGIVGGAFSAIVFVGIDLLSLGSAPMARSISFALLGLCLALAIFLANQLFSTLFESRDGQSSGLDFDKLHEIRHKG